MGKTAASGAKSSPTPATVVLAGALGCFAAGYGAHSLGLATRTIQKAVQNKLPAAVRNLLPTFTATTPAVNAALAPAIHEAKPAENPSSLQATVIAAETVVAEKTEAAVLKPEQPLRHPDKSLDQSVNEKGRADANESMAATTPHEGPPEAEVAFACDKSTECPSPEVGGSPSKEPRTSAATE
jgi:hypothetical protein